MLHFWAAGDVDAPVCREHCEAPQMSRISNEVVMKEEKLPEG